ncbi:MAG: FkbM family methyltransferase [Acidobacteriota bacterium]|nr:FkbM family methyltransferase [Acidobacteriota bacterium]
MRVSSLVALWRCYGPMLGLKILLHAGIYHYKKYILRHKLILRHVHNYRMYLDLNDPGISKTLAIVGTRELEHVYILQRELRKGMTVWDIGANIGYYALMEAQYIGSAGKVYAVEPSPSNYDLLKQNVTLNDCTDLIETFPLAISNRTGESKLYLSEMSNINTFHPLSFRFGTTSRNLSGNSVMVSTSDVLTFIENKRPIDLIRMDIEGHEVNVFESIVKAVEEKDFAAGILFETHFPKYDDAQHNMRIQLEHLFRLGYCAKWMASTDERKARFKEKGYVPEVVIKTDAVERGLYKNVRDDDAIEFICDLGGVRTVLLVRDQLASI